MNTLDDVYISIPAEMLPLRHEVRAVNSCTTDRSLCFYCGDPAECEDHAIPHSLLKRKGARRTGYGLDTLPACNECNGLLGSEVFFSLKERKNYVAHRVAQRYARHLATPKWEDRELAELGIVLIGSALGFNETKERIERRIGQLGIAPIIPALAREERQIAKRKHKRRKARQVRKRVKRFFVPLHPIAERLGKWIRYANGLWDFDPYTAKHLQVD